MSKRKIDFFIVGAQKSGTTSLYNLLGQCPQIYLPKLKELQCFVYDEYYSQLKKCLELNYGKKSEGYIRGAAQVQMLYEPLAAERLFRHNPNCKIILMLRNPVDRAYSGYWYARQFGYEKELLFERAIEDEAGRSGSCDSHVRYNLSHVSHGLYKEQIENYLKYFPGENVKVFLFEEFKRSPEKVLLEVSGFLDVPLIELVGGEGRNNRARMPRLRMLHDIIKSHDSGFKRIYRKVIPEVARLKINSLVVKKVEDANLKRYQYPDMNEITRIKLQNFYEETKVYVKEELNKDTALWW